jgi:hypothetical protein
MVNADFLSLRVAANTVGKAAVEAVLHKIHPSDDEMKNPVR